MKTDRKFVRATIIAIALIALPCAAMCHQKDEEQKEYRIAKVDQAPSFPGGEEAMYKWLSENIVYPEAAAKKGKEGRVVVEFLITETGEITNLNIVHGAHPALNREAVRLIRAMPKWIPGHNEGHPIAVTYTLPITFRLH